MTGTATPGHPAATGTGAPVPARRGLSTRAGLIVQRTSRTAILRAVDSDFVARFVKRYGMRIGARRFVVGVCLEEIVPVFRDFNARGMRATSGFFDDTAHRPEDVARLEAEYARQIDRLADEHLDANVALKLTHLGIHVDQDLMFEAVRRLLERAAARSMRLRIDMEESELVQPTLDLYRRLRAAGINNIGVCLQSYLRRSEGDLAGLLPLGLSVRLVKGAYLEPAPVAYQDKPDVDASYVRMLERSLSEAQFTAIATHDEAIIARAKGLISELGLSNERYEFQMLYGIRRGLQRRLVAEGYPLRIAAPYGPTWFPYLMRRLAERPANVLFVLRGAFR